MTNTYRTVPSVPHSILMVICTIPYLHNLCLPTGYIGFLQQVTDIQQSKRSSNLYYDFTLQVAEDDAKIICVMHQRGDGSKRQFFIDKMNAQQPIKLSNLPTQTSGTIFLNNATVIQDVPDHSVQFQFRELKPKGVTKISDVMKRSSGTFTVSGAVTWSGPAHAPGDQSTKLPSPTAQDQSRFPSGRSILTSFKIKSFLQLQIANYVFSTESV